ncbi:hypothetical protein BDW66DRAFT_52408 [Aspergillus desertorum]
MIYQSLAALQLHALGPPFSPCSRYLKGDNPRSRQEVRKQGTFTSQPVRTVDRSTSSSSIDQSVEGKRSRALSGRLLPANQGLGWYRVGSPKHATPADHLTCKSSLKPTIYDLLTPDDRSSFCFPRPAICLLAEGYHGCCAVFSRLCH